MGARRFLFTNKAMCFVVAVTALFSTATAFAEVRIVALGSSSIRGKGVPESEAYPAQLERALRARGHQVTVTNQGVNGDTTAGMLARLDSAAPPGTDIVVLKVEANDQVLYKVSPDVSAANIRTIVERLHARGTEVYLLKDMKRGLTDLAVESPPLPVGRWHLNPAGYAIVVSRTLPAVEALVRKVEKRR
jgi:hypothetical protein